MGIALLTPHDRPVPPAYRVAAATASVVVLVCFATASWFPWFVTQSDFADSFPVRPGQLFAALAVPACWLAFRWPVFGIALASLPLLATALDPAPVGLHFGVVANLCAVALATSWRRPRTAVVTMGIAELVVVGWVVSGGPMEAPFGSRIDTRYGAGPAGVLITYSVAFLLLTAFVLWLRSTVLREEQRVRLVAREGAVAEESAVVAERARLARDLHDVVAHHVSLIAVRAETAPYTEPELGESGRRVLAEVAAEARLALDELRGVLGILGRSGEAERSPQPTLADLVPLVERARRSGQDVHLEGDAGVPVPAAPGYAAYRVVQEALTNARKHAAGAPVTVVVAVTGRLVELRVTNPVADPPTGLGDGRGLAGMRERVEALGGRLHVRAAGREFELEAVIPTGGAA